MSEAQDISSALIPYEDLELTSQYPTIEPQPIVLRFSLPLYYFSCTLSTKFVVNMFCQLVSFVHHNQVWDECHAAHSNSLLPNSGTWLLTIFFFTCLICKQRPSVNSKGPGLGTKFSTKTSSIHLVHLCVQILSR